MNFGSRGSLFAQFLVTQARRATPLPSLSARPCNMPLPLLGRGAASVAFGIVLFVILSVPGMATKAWGLHAVY